MTFGAGVAAALVPARAQTAAPCVDPNEPTPEDFGPTDITAVSGNQSMSVALNADATVTVLKWPSPSYHDQIKYRTTDRSLPRMGALPNEGAFIGLAWRVGDKKTWKFSWLRQWTRSQRFADDDSDEVVTTFSKRKEGLKVTIRDLVADDVNLLARSVTVTRSATSNVTRARVISFANFNPVFSKTRQAHVQDWCTEEENDDGGTYNEDADAIVHARSGTDESTGQPSSVAVAMGFAAQSSGHEVGPDTFETTSAGTSAYEDAADGKLSGTDAAAGQADAALSDDVSLARDRSRTVTVLITAGAAAEDALNAMAEARDRSFISLSKDKSKWWRNWLDEALLPKDAPRLVVDLAKRALISMRQAADPDGLVVTSIATQSPLGLDWIRHGAYINRALHMAGHPEMVEDHNRRYANLEASFVTKPPGGESTPPGNWSQNFYADGVVGGTTPYEVDATGLGIWTLWDHYDRTSDRDYLDAVYEAIQLAAQYLSDACRDATNGLQCLAHEEDGESPSQTLRGAQAVWLGLDAAARAARARGGDALPNAEKWETRRDEVGEAIEQQFRDEDCNCYTLDYEVGGTLLWPVGYLATGSGRARSQAEVNWKAIAPAVRGKDDRGRLEARALLGNAYAYPKGDPALGKVRRGLEWVARVPTTNGTGLLGQDWMVFPPGDGQITTMVSQPHVWNQAIFYLAALRAYGSTGYSFK